MKKSLVLGLLLIILLISCKKNVAITDIKQQNGIQDDTTTLALPSITKGILVFINYKSLDYYKNAKKDLTNSPNSGGGGSFISMLDAFTALVDDDAAVAQQLEIDYPNGPASIFDQTHSNFTSQYPNTFYIKGDSVDGYYYELNCFDRDIANVINPDGLVIIGNTIFQFTKDYYKAWIGGNINNLSFITNAVNNTGNNLFVTDVNSQNSIDANANLMDGVVRTLYTKWNRSCENTKNISGKKRIIGYVDFLGYFRLRPSPPTNADRLLWPYAYTTQTRSLKGRLFGAWFDNWKTPHGQKGTIQAQTQNSGLSYSLFDYSAKILITVDWSYYDQVENDKHTWKLNHPRPIMVDPYLLPFEPDYIERWDYSSMEFYRPVIISQHEHISTAFAGFAIPNDNPNCTCRYNQ